jgi:hypothetical protein
MRQTNPVLTTQHKQHIATVVKHKPSTPPPTPSKPDDGQTEWRRFKSECVLLKGRGGK